MTLILEILLGILALICFLGGANILSKGAMSFLPKELSPQLVLDNLVRFLSGIYLSAGFLFSYSVFNLNEVGNIVYFLGLLVVFSGLGRLYSRLRMGSAGKYFDSIMIVEILLGIGVILIAYLR